MKLHHNQLLLIRHLIRFNSLDYESCLNILDTDNTHDKIALSYQFRPLTKNDYVSKNKKGIVAVLRKGRTLFPDEKPFISEGTNEKAIYRTMQVSRMAALMEKCGVTITDKLPQNASPHFIPSACWRNIAPGILSTTRFVGMLLAFGKKYAVYDIGDGSMEWQVRAESSLFYTRYGLYETKADGMIMVCDADKRNEIAENIIRQTMWNRKALMNTDYTERNRPVRFSRSPIRLRTQYERVYLTTPEFIKEELPRIFGEDDYIKEMIPEAAPTHDPREGDLEKWPIRYYVSRALNLLKLVYFFSAVKAHHELESNNFPVENITYSITMYMRDLKIIKMYPDILYSERVKFREFRSNGNT